MLGVNVRVDVRGQEKKKEEDEEEEAGDWPRAAGRVVWRWHRAHWSSGSLRRRPSS